MKMAFARKQPGAYIGFPHEISRQKGTDHAKILLPPSFRKILVHVSHLKPYSDVNQNVRAPVRNPNEELKYAPFQHTHTCLNTNSPLPKQTFFKQG